MSKSIEKLKDMICDEIDHIASQGELTAGSLDTVDKLTHSLKSIETIIAMEDSGYSNSIDPHIRYGKYSRDNEKEALLRKLRDVLSDASSDKDRSAIKRCISEMEG